MTEARSLGAARSSWALLAALVLAAVATVALLSSEGAAVRPFKVVGSLACGASPHGGDAEPERSAALPPPALLHRLELPWEPALTRAELARGVSYYGSGARLHRLASKLLAGRPIKAFSLGGSVTGGGGAVPPEERGYVPLLFKAINSSFPHRDHVLENRAISASTAFLFAACLQHHVPPDADLVTLEFTLNEAPFAEMASPERKYFELLLRRLLASPAAPAVLVLHHYGWWEAAGDGLDRGLFYREPESALSALSHFYDVPTVSVRAAAWRLMQAGLMGFKADRVLLPGQAHTFFSPLKLGTIPTAAPAAAAAYFYRDSVHPSNSGHQVLAELLAEPLARAVREVQLGLAVTEADERADPRLAGLPPPMIPGNADEAPGVCAMQEAFKDVVVASSGFEYLPERPNATDFMHQKWGWRGTKPGDWAELELDTTQRGGDDGGGSKDTFVWLSYLRSYAGMGVASVECVGGCRCEGSRLDGTWERRASLFYAARFHVSRHPHCRIRVTVTDRTGRHAAKGDAGRKMVLAAAMVTHLQLDSAGSLGLVAQLDSV